MASKKKEELSYGQMPLPQSRKAYKITKRSWSGLNYRQTIDTGLLSMEQNISTDESPYLTPSPKESLYYSGYQHPISMFGFDNFLIVIYRHEADNTIRVDYITSPGAVHTGILKKSGATVDDEYPRSIVQFNVYDTPTDPVTGEYVKKLLIFPDKASMDFNFKSVARIPDEPENMVTYHTTSNGKDIYTVYDVNGECVEYEDYFPITDMNVTVKEYYSETEEEIEGGSKIYPPPDSANRNYYYHNKYNSETYKWSEYEAEDGSIEHNWRVSSPPNIPNIKYATVHLSRVFGVDDDRVYASGYNDYANWNLDTVGEYNESNSWCSPAQSNTKAGGQFTGITTYQGHVICFKRDFMHEIYNTKNPFRLQDIFGEGTIDNRTIQDVDGKLIFVSEDNVKIYTGSNPRIISYYLNIGEYKSAISGTDGRCYYLYCEDNEYNKRFFVYDTITEQWSERNIKADIGLINFAHNKNGMYMLCDRGNIYKIDTQDYSHEWSFETDLITNQTVDIKHIRKMQMFAQLDENSLIKVYVLYDDEEFNKNSHLVYSSNNTGQIAIRVKPRQTANYGIKLHIEGYGYAKLYELELILESGGDLYV